MSTAILILLVCGFIAWGDLAVNISVNPTYGLSSADTIFYQEEHNEAPIEATEILVQPQDQSPWSSGYYFPTDPAFMVTVRPLAALTL